MDKYRGRADYNAKAYQNSEPMYNPAVLEIIEQINRDAYGPSKVYKPKPAPRDFMKENIRMLKQMQIKNKEERSNNFPPLRPTNRFSRINLKVHEPSCLSVSKISECVELGVPNTLSDFPKVSMQSLASFNSRRMLYPASSSRSKTSSSHTSECAELEVSNASSDSFEGAATSMLNEPADFASSKTMQSTSYPSSSSISKATSASHLNLGTGHHEKRFDRKMQCFSCSQRNRIKPQEPLKPVTPHPLGYLPPYIAEEKRKCEEIKRLEKEAEEKAAIPPGHVLLSDEDRLQTLDLLVENHEELILALQRLPICLNTLKIRKYKEELERKLAKVEEGIKIFTRPKVFVRTDL